MLGTDIAPQTALLVAAALILLLTAFGSHRTQQPGQRLSFFLRTAKDAAVLLTVLALVINLRNSTVATRQDAYSRSLDYFARLQDAALANPAVGTMLYLPGDPFLALNPDDRARYQYLLQVIEFYQRLWLLERDGALDEQAWAGWERWLEDGIVPIPLFTTVWTEERRYYHEDFVDYVDEKLAEVGTTAARPALPVATPDG